MTGEKNRYKPLDTLLKLDDEQLKTPKHDEMVLWLLNKDNLKKVIPELFESLTQIKTRHTRDIFNLNEDLKKLKEDPYPTQSTESEIQFIEKLINIIKPQIKIVSEEPIKAQNGFIIGYWDIKVYIEFNLLFSHYKSYFPATTESFRQSQNLYFIEVKPKINSFGTTLRQLQTYRSYESSGNVFLFTEDLRFKDAFESQGIRVLSPPSRQTSLTEGGVDD